MRRFFYSKTELPGGDHSISRCRAWAFFPIAEQPSRGVLLGRAIPFSLGALHPKPPGRRPTRPATTLWALQTVSPRGFSRLRFPWLAKRFAARSSELSLSTNLGVKLTGCGTSNRLAPFQNNSADRRRGNASALRSGPSKLLAADPRGPPRPARSADFAASTGPHLCAGDPGSAGPRAGRAGEATTCRRVSNSLSV